MVPLFCRFDPYNILEMPYDEAGHGTHVTGTICGAKGIGVYPAAKWIGCKGCGAAQCDLSTLLMCGQFMTCPTLPNLTKKDCSKAPHVINNSWGGGQGADWFDVVIEAWHQAGIIPVFSGKFLNTFFQKNMLVKFSFLF